MNNEQAILENKAGMQSKSPENLSPLPSGSELNELQKMSSLSQVDRDTLDLRGAMGYFKPEDPEEIALCKKALTDGATRQIEWWFIEDYPKAIEFRETFKKCGVDLPPRERPRG